MKVSPRLRPIPLALAAAVVINCTTSAQAQSVSSNNLILEEMIVSARKRAENLQDIPDSVTVFNEAQIRDARITTIKDFSALTPNLTVATSFRSGLNFVTIRGLITPQVGEAPLAFVVDGVTVPNLEFINQGLQEIESIEVLRGPQGALYGKNAIGGAVNIVTKQPSDELEGRVQASYAEGNDKKISGSLSGPLVEDKVYFRVSGNYRDFDGLIDNDYLGEEVDYINGAYGFQGMLKFNMSDVSSLTLNGRYSDVVQGSNYLASIEKDDLENFDIEAQPNVVGRDESTLQTLSAKYDYEMDGGDFTFIAGWNDADITFFSDADFGHADASAENFFFPSMQSNPINEDSINIESRYTSYSDGPLDWSLGVFYETRDRTVEFDTIFDLQPTERVTHNTPVDPSLVFAGERTVQDTEAYAVFGQTNYAVSDVIDFTFALRYDSETREAYDERAPQLSKAKETYSEIQPKASIAWQASDDALLSATYSKGFRSGGFNEYSPFVVRDYDEEISDTFEIGAKTTWMDGRLLLNMAAFYIEQQDAQFTRFNGNTLTLENLNVDEVEIKGLEIEITAKASETIQLSLGAGYIDNEIVKNTGTDILTGKDLALSEGDTMPYVADFNLNGAISYLKPVDNNMDFKARLAFNTLGPLSYDIFNDDTGESDTHTFFNASLGLETDTWSLLLFANNLSDEDAPETVYSYNPLIRMRNQPRQIGVQASYDF
ncbi:TonB-dependent receptor [Dasania marina]|uniref:TonB-dependent receptor n=1 Tax=Dasania marina TaxID=471499 RepID=UPI00036BCC77|nr:TonB-dependent receptor [Dasania marina]|tara:strand:+ start:22939 stop:25089 length:2151 start_codon:yes stop_codon:yes gene_type:complete